jgi:carboxypeptidase Taq
MEELMEERFRELEERLAHIVDLGATARLLGWDQQTMMPRGGAQARAEQLATIEQLAHEQLVSPELGDLLEELRPYEEGLPRESREASLVRVARRDRDKAVRVPPELAAEITRASSLAQHAWIDARARSDFEGFLPYLERNVELKRRYIDCFEPAAEPYDVLLDDYEEGTTAAEVRTVFARLKERLVPLIAAVSERADAVDASCLDGSFPIERQKEVVKAVLERFGFDDDSWRIDLTAHPFATNTTSTDIRLTTRYFDDNLSGLFASMHEFGHGLYEHGSDAALERTPLAGGVSLGLHESQSRLWENLVGRSLPFWTWFFPVLREAFPGQLDGVDAEAFHRAANQVRPSLIRVEADQVTYNLHVILRFELEQELLDGGLALRDLPEAWNAKVKEYLGIDVPDDAQGVLQDIHWAGGIFGYFPTYSLGNVMSVQIWETLRGDIPDLDGRIEAGEFGALAEWLREHLHRHGRKFTPKETLELVTGSPIDPEPYLDYLDAKVRELYRVGA